ncbi:MAG: transglutaminaseTgpA domain-containing protein, partial [Candidatus Polarisedimenticolia bacterium]
MTHRFALLTIRNGVASCLMLATTALLAVQAIGPWHALLLAAGIVYGRRTRRPLRLPPRAWDALAVAALLMFPLELMLGSGNLIGAALRLLSFVVLYRCANLSEHQDLRQAVALSFVQMLAAAASTTEVWFSAFLVAYLFMAVWTLMAMASARDGAPASARRAPPGRPATAMTSLTVMAGALFFVAIPHFGTGYFQPATARGTGDTLSGFSDRIELGAISRIKKNRAVVMRVRLHGQDDPAAPPLRWRGVALDTFDGRSWSVASNGRRWVGRDPDGSFHVGAPLRKGETVLDQEVSMMPLMVPVLFTSPGPSRVVFEGTQALGVDDGGAVHLAQPPLSRFTYRVISPTPGRALSGYGGDDAFGSSPVNLALPHLDPRIVKLAERIAAGAATPLDGARRIEQHLRTRYDYSLEVEDRGVPDPLGRFLIERQPGHCEYFATAMAVMLRCLEIPSRVVNGFQSGEWSALTGVWVVRQADAHTWVEAWIDGQGWVTFDPTPADSGAAVTAGLLAGWSTALRRLELMWDTWVVGLDLLDQQSLAASLFDGAALAALGGAALVGRLAASFSSLAASGWPALAAIAALVAGALAAGWL